MRSVLQISFLATLLISTLAAVPNKDGFKIVWADDFEGKLQKSEWNHEQSSENGESQFYQANEQIIGTDNGNLYIYPRYSDNGEKWYSGRIASWKTFTPSKGKTMTMEAQIKLGDAAEKNKKGIWPAFWALGSSIYGGKPWPKCGEWDIMEAKNGEGQFIGVLHYGDSAPGKSSPAEVKPEILDPTKWHTYSMEVNRQSDNWQEQAIKWWVDGKNYQTVKGSDVGNFDDWVTLAHSPYYALFNVAIGGDSSWPGKYNKETTKQSGKSLGMEVGYFAVYETN